MGRPTGIVTCNTNGRMRIVTDRPDWHPSWPEVPEGHEVVAIIDPDWEALPDGSEIICSQGSRYARCCNVASAVLTRKRRRRDGKLVGARFRYCPDHMYGRWVEEGFVMHWILVKVGSDDA